MLLNNQIIVSIIVPIYNSEKYLEQCLGSIKAQKFHNFEVLMINDGSTDKSEEICRKYVYEDKRFVLINQENKGVCEARNHALRIAKGIYIAFVDSDDKINSTFLSTLINEIMQNKSDIAFCDFYNETGVESAGKWKYERIERDKIYNYYLEGKIYNRIMNKVYKKDLILDIFFPSDRPIMEDAFWTANALSRCKKISIIPQGLYYYRITKGSLSRRKYSESEECGMYRNEIEKYIIIAEKLTDNDSIEILYNKIGDLIENILFSKRNLEIQGVFEKLKELLAIPIMVSCKNENTEIIRMSKSYHDAYNMHLKEVLFSKSYGVHKRLNGIFRLIKSLCRL